MHGCSLGSQILENSKQQLQLRKSLIAENAITGKNAYTKVEKMMIVK